MSEGLVLWYYTLSFDTAASVTAALVQKVDYATRDLLAEHTEEVPISPGGVGEIRVDVISVDATTESFYKKVRVTEILDDIVIVDYIVEVSVPPFNGLRRIWGSIINTQEHLTFPPAPPPPPVQPPPTSPPPVVIPPPAGPPVEVILEPVDDRPPAPITLPPPTDPPPVDWQPGPLPPDVVPPPRTRDTDIFTLRAFAEKWGDQVTRYALNVPLDSGEIVDDLEEPYRTLWSKLTAHKADLVFERKGIIYVAEIKPRLSRGLGDVYKRQIPFRSKTKSALWAVSFDHKVR